MMKLWEGRVYFDDRLFILDLSLAKKGGKDVWAVTTRRNCRGFPPWRVDDFTTEEAAIDYIQKIEPSTPRISLSGKSPNPEPSYQDYCQILHDEGVPSSLEIRELNRGVQREIIIEELSPGDVDA